MLGRVLAMNLEKTVGDTVDVAGEPFQVVGIFESDSLFENGGLIVPLDVLQKMMGREGDVSGFVVSAEKLGPARGRGAGEADRGGGAGRGGGPGARLRAGGHPDPAGQVDGLGDVGDRHGAGLDRAS